jgi:hypothetical protein
VLFNNLNKPYISVKLAPKEKAVDLMQAVLDIMTDKNFKE